ncbi:MAG: metallophosphoesterase family protein [Alphaproteobacteria bacterium]
MKRWLPLLLLFCCLGCERSWSFAVLGDSSPDGIDDPPSIILRRAVMRINQTDAELVLFTGDLVHGRTTQIKDTQRQYADVKNVLTTLRAPLLIVPGNHDVDGAGGAENWRRLFGPAPWAYEHRDWAILGLSTEEPGTRGLIVGKQRGWLEDQLPQHDRAKGVIVVMHRPAWPTLNPEHRYHSLPQPELHQLLQKYRVKAVFSGHEHHFHQHRREGVEYIITGGAGASLLPDGFHHFLLVRVEKGKIFAEIIRIS